MFRKFASSYGTLARFIVQCNTRKKWTAIMLKNLSIITLAAIIAFCSAATFYQGLTPEEIAGKVQAVYDLENGLSAEFSQTYISGSTGASDLQSGVMTIKKPGMMRWDYRRPEVKQYISNGEKIYLYIPKEKQVQVFDIEEANQEQTHLLFLMGEGQLNRDFKITFSQEIEPRHPDSYMIRLVPLKEEFFDYLVFEVNPRDFFVERIISVDPLYNKMEISFANIKREKKADSFFQFEVPRGVEVIDMAEMQ
jgi:outer membrane lipoprotein carrier protein